MLLRIDGVERTETHAPVPERSRRYRTLFENSDVMMARVVPDDVEGLLYRLGFALEDLHEIAAGEKEHACQAPFFVVSTRDIEDGFQISGRDPRVGGADINEIAKRHAGSLSKQQTSGEPEAWRLQRPQ